MTNDSRIFDLWETNSGGLMLTERWHGKGWSGFEMGQNERRNLEVSREEFTLASDAPCFDDLGEGSAYSKMARSDVERAYAFEGRTNEPVRVASWEEGKIKLRRDVSIGMAARWYLGQLPV